MKKNINTFLLIIIHSLFYFVINLEPDCFEYSCEKCLNNSKIFGLCKKCKPTFIQFYNSCPCYDPNCALCTSGYPGGTCELCKKGSNLVNGKCKCNIDFCLICSENGCNLCQTNYHYNSVTNKCEQNSIEDKIECYDQNCDICFSGEEGACEKCNVGYALRKGSCKKLLSPNEDDEKCERGYINSDNFCDDVCEGIFCPVNIRGVWFCENDIGKNCVYCDSDFRIKFLDNCTNMIYSNQDDCLITKTPDECIKCFPGYYLLQGKCEKCQEGCAYCINKQKCESCFIGFSLSADKTTCVLNNTHFEFSLIDYEKKRNELIERNKPPNLCDVNCADCNYDQCLSCKDGYYLRDNLCFTCPYNNCNPCYDSNCLSCPDDEYYCTECGNGYTLSYTSCILPSPPSSSSSNKNINYTLIAIIAVGAVLIGMGIGLFIYIHKRTSNSPPTNPQNPVQMNSQNNQEGVIRERNSHANLETERQMKKDELEEEFDQLYRSKEKGEETCQFCKKNRGKYLCDCGCIVCKEHSELKTNKDGNKICYVCSKVVKVVKPKYICGICREDTIEVSHFACYCSFEVCRVCYVKHKLENNKCPQCRKAI